MKRLLALGLLGASLASSPPAIAADAVGVPVLKARTGQSTMAAVSSALDDVQADSKVEVQVVVRGLLNQADQLRTEYHAQKAELLKSMRHADAQTREEVRARLRQVREEFVAAKRENFDGLQNAVKELKEKLAEHRELLDNAKAQSRGRKGDD